MTKVAARNDRALFDSVGVVRSLGAFVVAPHPRHGLVAAGYEDGTTILAFLDRAIPVLVHRGGEGAVSALAWSDDGRCLAIGTEGGLLAVARLEDWRAPRRR
jgi:hypothetical protein